MRVVRKIGFMLHSFTISKASQQKHFDLRIPADCLCVESVLITNTAFLTQTDELINKAGEVALQVSDSSGVFYQSDIYQQDKGASDIETKAIEDLPFNEGSFVMTGTALAFCPVSVSPGIAVIRGRYKDFYLQEHPQANAYRVKLYFQYEKKPSL